ncbi:hypothetical protein HU200_033873 [Digitaria exilis]|uniref:Late embryogenesis abundant protein LEA-2 subgroup domain-containing protein n=1 Tax=Digitaria exilis TaxID=1010633 RepID=A0A835EP88_9POAL|nr:hypothetical protein HU200_033873 [Digitaria exilis]
MHNLCDMHRSRRRIRTLAISTVLALLLIGAVAVSVYFNYRPAKPQASVARAAVYQLESVGNRNSSVMPPPYAIAARAQFTLALHNPSDHAVVLYDELIAYMTYRGELVAPPVELPVVVQEHGADVSLSLLFGSLGSAEPQPVAEETVRALAGDCAARRVLLRIVILGQVRYKSGPFKTAWRDLFMRCDVTTGLGGDAMAGGGGAGGMPLVEYPQCFVDA